MPTTQANKKARERTAYHEAGHAVVAYLLGRPFEYVSIEPDKESLGRVVYKRFRKKFPSDNELIELSANAQRWLEETIQTLLAGWLSEILVFGYENEIDSSHERKTAIDIASKVCFEPDECSAYLYWLRIRTRNLLSLNWRREAVKAVARALLEHKTMDGDSVVKIIENVVNEAYMSYQTQKNTSRSA